MKTYSWEKKRESLKYIYITFSAIQWCYLGNTYCRYCKYCRYCRHCTYMAESSLGFFASFSLIAAHQGPVGFTNVFSIGNTMDPGSTKSPCRCAYFSPGMELFYTKTLDQYRHEIQTNTNYNILLEGWSKLCSLILIMVIYHGCGNIP